MTPVKVAVEAPSPSKIFENGKAWSTEGGWWVQPQKGISFTRANETAFTFTLLKDPKSILKEKVKKYEFVADYRDNDNKILYTLDPHHLTRKVYVDGKEQKANKSEQAISAPGPTYSLTVQITSDSITVKVNGVADVMKRSEPHGQFGFVNEVVLISH